MSLTSVISYEAPPSAIVTAITHSAEPELIQPNLKPRRRMLTGAFPCKAIYTFLWLSNDESHWRRIVPPGVHLSSKPTNSVDSTKEYTKEPFNDAIP